MKHPRWHAECKWEEREIKAHGVMKNNFNHSFCLDHQVLFCRCGWEWGWHSGTDNEGPLKRAWRRREPNL